MSEGGNEAKLPVLTLTIPVIKAESETQTVSHLVSRPPETKTPIMEPQEEKISLRKRRNLSKNRVQAARQREKTPEPGVMGIQEDIATSEDEENQHPRNSREIEADSTYKEMKRLVEEKANVKDPVYDLDTDEVLNQRAQAAHDRRRRSISPFAVQDLAKINEICNLQRKGSFTDPTNKLLSANYTMSPKEEDTTKRRSSLTIEPPREGRSSLSPPTSTSTSPKDKSPFILPTTPKKLEEMVYPDEGKEVKERVAEDRPKNLRTPVTKDSVFTFEDIDTKLASTKATDTPAPIVKAAPPKTPETPAPVVKPTTTSKPTETSVTVSRPMITQKSPEAPAKPSIYPKGPETPIQSGEIITKVIQVERTPSKKMSQENRPVVEIRERIVRTPSRKLSVDWQPLVAKQPPKPVKEETQTKMPPVKPARSKSASRFGSKTSESEMSEDQQNVAAGARRKVIPTPRRFMKNRSPRANRSQSVARVDELKVVDKTGTEMTKTGKEIIELMQHRARSLSIPKDDPRLPPEYKRYSKTLQTPNKTPVSRTSRGISCPKTIQIISDKEILSSITSKSAPKKVEPEQRPIKPRRRSSGYIDASQSEYTSSCYSSSPSENEYDFDLSDRTEELTRKLNLLSKELARREIKLDEMSPGDSIIKTHEEPKSVLRKRSVVENKNGVKRDKIEPIEDKKVIDKLKKKPTKSRWKLLANWQQFKEEQKNAYDSIILLRNRCICDSLLMIILFGLGGLMFKSLEGSFENAYKCGSRGVKRDFIESLWRGSHYLREEDWKSMARKKLHEFEDQLHTAHEAGVKSFSSQKSWNFMNSFVYCMTLVTTIGYGHIAPQTMYGRVATIVYAIIGIPLFLLVLADFGKLFTRIIKFFWAYIRRFYYTRSCRKVRRMEEEVMKGLNNVVRRPSQIFNKEEEDEQPPTLERKPSDVPPPLPPKPGHVFISDVEEPETPAPSVFEVNDEFNLPITVALVILIVYIVIGAVIYQLWEGWDFLDSFYFVFISMSTIGLGDFVPKHPIYMMCSIFYLVFGLALTSMCINVVQLKLSDTFKKATTKLSSTIGLKIEEADGSLVPITPSLGEIVPVHKGRTENDESTRKGKDDSKTMDDSRVKEGGEDVKRES